LSWRTLTQCMGTSRRNIAQDRQRRQATAPRERRRRTGAEHGAGRGSLGRSAPDLGTGLEPGLGVSWGDTFGEVFPRGTTPECGPGVEEAAGQVACRAPANDHLTLFVHVTSSLRDPGGWPRGAEAGCSAAPRGRRRRPLRQGAERRRRRRRSRQPLGPSSRGRPRPEAPVCSGGHRHLSVRVWLERAHSAGIADAQQGRNRQRAARAAGAASRYKGDGARDPREFSGNGPSEQTGTTEGGCA